MMNRISKKYLFKKFSQNYPELKANLEKAYANMIKSFDES
jgi:hypothetical protein